MKSAFDFLLKKYNSKEMYLVLGYIFLIIGVYFVLSKEKSTYELLFIISITQFALYFFKKYFFKNKKGKSN